MRRFKVALVDFDGNSVPDWVPEAFAKEGIDFIARECKTSVDLVHQAGDADVIWIWGSHVITAESLALLPQCVAIIRTGSGTDHIPVEAATQRGIVVANTPEAHNDAVSDHAIGLMFAVMRQIASRDRDVRSGKWNAARPWPGAHLHGQTLGLVGFGHIARLVAMKMSGFKMMLLAHDPYVSPDAMAAESVHSAPLDELLTKSDFVFVH